MHGYIARLVINNNGLPHSYRPILPINDFGSYTAGYNVLTALISGMQVSLLRYSVNILTIAVYPMGLLALIFFLTNFFTEKIAVYTGVLLFGLSSTYQGIIGWGGNPTFLSFGMCLFSWGAVISAVRHRSRSGLLFTAFVIAAIPLVHAIPAITFLYISLPAGLFLLYFFRDRVVWVITQIAVLLVEVAVLLLPFILHYRPEHSPALLQMIKDWQHLMMGQKPMGNAIANISSTVEQVKYFAGDVLVILSGISVVFLIYFRRFKALVITTLMMVFIFVIILNYCYWVLPFSELLYPERVAYFLLVCLASYVGSFITVLEEKAYQFKAFGKPVKVYLLLASLLATISIVKLFNGSAGLAANKDTQYDHGVTDAFNWINANTETNAVCYVSYTGIGMWVPAFTNRATIGTHYHFIHIIRHVEDSIRAAGVPEYIFVTQKDKEKKNGLLNQITGRSKVFSNSAIDIYH